MNREWLDQLLAEHGLRLALTAAPLSPTQLPPSSRLTAEEAGDGQRPIPSPLHTMTANGARRSGAISSTENDA